MNENRNWNCHSNVSIKIVEFISFKELPINAMLMDHRMCIHIDDNCPVIIFSFLFFTYLPLPLAITSSSSSSSLSLSSYGMISSSNVYNFAFISFLIFPYFHFHLVMIINWKSRSPEELGSVKEVRGRNEEKKEVLSPT